ncbi:hypothetical protein CV102_22535 [Natronococcus pandeyae]|uniref:Gluconate 2-dehydrogenase subunit 3 family protein n=1 Tax=Natronococcus pandeyae TaxID=2055836 RepID=A0A8J8Q3F3_9EURY|nr:gluconate 2-dehydrogenase subunit 3 family protein [Natronococcus pandeyae]TYL36405.1 hypothetical protein CV102_22535 [Natronococcus pandeyae]
MKLTRRDAVAALTAAGVSASAVAMARLDDRASESGAFTARDLDVLLATADVVYPSAVSVTEEFIETYSVGRVQDREVYRTGMKRAIADVNAYAGRYTGTPFPDLAPSARDQVLREMGVDRVQPEPEGTVPEQVRYYLVNELLYALYSTPTGGELVGLENPPGYAGGLESYQQAPEDRPADE